MFSLELGAADILQRPCPGAPRSHLYPCSYDSENFIYLADFPKELFIKYLVNSFLGDIAIVTETEEVACCPIPTPNPWGLPSLPVRVKGPKGGNTLRNPGEGQQNLHL